MADGDFSHRIDVRYQNEFSCIADSINRMADTVETMVRFRIGRCHPLTGDRNGQFAVDLVHPYRLVFEKNGEEIQIANIIEIVDYH